MLKVSVISSKLIGTASAWHTCQADLFSSLKQCFIIPRGSLAANPLNMFAEFFIVYHMLKWFLLLRPALCNSCVHCLLLLLPQANWLPSLKEMVDHIHATFDLNFAQIGCNGQVTLHEAENDDYAKYAIHIRCVTCTCSPTTSRTQGME